MAGNARRRGFTLIELLVVISVIVVLMALIIPAIGLARRKGQETNTRSALMQIQAGISKFATFNAGIPEIPLGEPPGTTYHALFDPDKYAPQQIKTGEVSKNSEWLLAHLSTVDNENFGKQSPYRGKDVSTSNMLVDIWGKPFAYRPFAKYPFDSDAPEGDINSDEPPSPDSYQLWSFGYARLNNNGTDDDISSWTK